MPTRASCRPCVCVNTRGEGNTPWPVESPRGHLGSLGHVADAPGPSVHPPPSQPNQPVLIFHVWHIHLRMSDPASEVESSFPGRKIEELMKLTPQKNKYKYAWPLQAALSRAVIINLPVHQNQHIKKLAPLHHHHTPNSVVSGTCILDKHPGWWGHSFPGEDA